MVYAPARFLLDFLRETEVSKVVSHPDVRHLGLTPAQWACLATAAARRPSWRRPRIAAARASPPTGHADGPLRAPATRAPPRTSGGR